MEEKTEIEIKLKAKNGQIKRDSLGKFTEGTGGGPGNVLRTRRDTIYKDLIKSLHESDCQMLTMMFESHDISLFKKEVMKSKVLNIFQKTELMAMLVAIKRGDRRFHEAMRIVVLGKAKETMEIVNVTKNKVDLPEGSNENDVKKMELLLTEISEEIKGRD